MSARREPLFVARRRYRLRRAADAARLLPVLGLILILAAPLRAAAGASAMVGQLVYLFGVWAGLILAAFVISRLLAGALPAPPDSADGEGDDRL